jgi:hypothetical protein
VAVDDESALLGVGAGLIIPSVTASAMGSLPGEHTGVGGGTNGTFLQTGGASLLHQRHARRLLTAAIVALAGAVIALATLPGKAPATRPAAAARGNQIGRGK